MKNYKITPNSFQFIGSVPGSKSIYNRALIVQSFFPNLNIQGSSSCDDVVYLQEALSHLRLKKNSYFCGEGGTTFRFLAFRLSREPGVFELNMDPALAKRPHQSIIDTLSQLGVEARWLDNKFLIHSRGWKNPDKPLKIKSSESSQFLSGVLLNAWNLEFPLSVDLSESITSESYFRMTLSLLKELGMNFQIQDSSLVIPAQQRVAIPDYSVESDLSSCFSIAALAALCGHAELIDFPFQSKQPDLSFLELFRRMNISWLQQGTSLIISKSDSFNGIDADLGNSPDLFPVLAALCSFAQTPTRLYGAPQLVKKESNRIKKTSELLSLFGVSHKTFDDGLEIVGKPLVQTSSPLQFDPESDHRMVMAASLFLWKGFNLQIKNSPVVRKSFPEFLNIALPGMHS